MTNRQEKLLELKVKQIYNELLSEGPNADAQIRIVKSMINVCNSFVKGNMAGLPFLTAMTTELNTFKKTVGK